MPVNVDTTVDPITLEVLREGLISIVREMRITMSKIAYSSVLYEAHDFSCALFDRTGQTIAQSEDLPGHVIPLPWIVRSVMEEYAGNIHPGDLFILNDPYRGGTHLPDVTVVYPFFIDGELVLFPAMRAHWADVGGMTPGSISGKATEIYQEGIRIPPIKLYERGQINQQLMDLLLANMRLPEERKGDLRAMVGTCRTAERRVREVVARYGRPAMERYMATILDRAEARMRARIAAIPDGEYCNEDYWDFSGSDTNPVRVQVRLTVRGDTVEADFTGSSPCVAGPINASLAVTTSGVFVVLKSAIDPSGAVNSGTFRPITVVAPEGTVLNATPPAATGGFSEVRRKVSAVTLGALAQALPRAVAGDVKGTANHTYIGGWNPRKGKQYVYYEYPHGGVGGFRGGDGSHALACYNSGDSASIQPVEALESEYPLMIDLTELRVDSAGDGTWRGGCGMRREVRIVEGSGSFSELSDRNVIPPFGVLGGTSGRPNRFVVRQNGKVLEPSDTPGKVTGFPLRTGDTLIELSAGGGGYGDPLARSAEAVAEDVMEGVLSRERAEAVYGVILRDGAVDTPATVAGRAALAAARPRLSLSRQALPEIVDGKRPCYLSPATAQRLGLVAGQVVEYVGPTGMVLRGWVTPQAEVEPDAVFLGEFGRRVLGLKDGDTVVLRPLFATTEQIA
ncbi:MAG: hypothetical protein A3G35_19320 [candidate division NC10 bacterium RIFCSPLOWO2_12_FULL_66_18]|nr:MAG: hypothetical protein A3H39_07355 [candidate division NC10 bacterium RIFCSPLOWO2_02_FULL_66_22]OGB99878.1 MAG: hypothetical protein A3G35_19320 [candidate division NC10 bacterium RIFCSPLOWO2_12_FULL_66_18]